LITGIGAGLVSPVLPAIAMSSAPAAHSGVAAAAANSARQLGLALGIALLGTVFHRYVPGAGDGASHAAYANGLDAVFLLAGGDLTGRRTRGSMAARTPGAGAAYDPGHGINNHVKIPQDFSAGHRTVDREKGLAQHLRRICQTLSMEIQQFGGWTS